MPGDVKKVCTKLLVFLLPIAIIWGYLEYKLGRIPNTYSQKRVYLEHQLDSVQLLALGTSHIFYGVNPTYLSMKGFNLANVNQSLYYNKRLTLKYIDRMPRLKLVILEIGYFSFYYQIRQDNKERWRDYFYSQYWGINYKDLPLWHMKRYSKVALYTTEIVKKYIKDGFKEDLAEHLQPNGFMPRDTLQPKDSAQLKPENFLTRIKGLNLLIDTNQRNYIYNDVAEFIRELKNRHIEVAFVTTPWLPQLTALSNKQIFDENTLLTQQLCARYNCKYYNYLTDPRFDKNDFADPNHLNYRGAEKLTRIIDQDIVVPFMKSH